MSQCWRSFLFLGVFLATIQPSSFALNRTDYVVELRVTVQDPEALQPWKKGVAYTVSASGLLFKKNFILTNAHVIENAELIYGNVKGEWLPLKPVKKMVEMDLALLEFQSNVDLEPWHGKMEAAQIGEKVRVLGYPLGGTNLSLTEGIISRYDSRAYYHANHSFPVIQVDAAINKGNSGGPAFDQDGNLVGITFAGIANAQNIGYLIPTSIIDYFLSNSTYPNLGIKYQTLVNQSLRNYLNVDHGVMVTEVALGSTADGELQEQDVILEIDGQIITSQGTYKNIVPASQKNKSDSTSYVHLSNLINLKSVGEQVDIKIFRKGQLLNKKLTLKKYQRNVIPTHDEDGIHYLQYAGLIFIEITREALSLAFEKKVPLSFEYFLDRFPNKNQRRVITIASILPVALNDGLDLKNEILEMVNDRPVADLNELKQELLQQDVLLKFVSQKRAFFSSKQALEVTKKIDVDQQINNPLFVTPPAR